VTQKKRNITPSEGSQDVGEVFGGLHRPVQGTSMGMLVSFLYWGEHLNKGENSSGTCAFSNSGRNLLQQIFFFFGLSLNEELTGFSSYRPSCPDGD